MPDGASADIWLSDRAHLNRRHDPSIHTGALESIHHHQGVHHGGKHAHVISGSAIHAALQALFATPNVSRTDDNSDFHAHFMNFLDAPCDRLSFRYINSKTRSARQRLAA